MADLITAEHRAAMILTEMSEKSPYTLYMGIYTTAEANVAIRTVLDALTTAEAERDEARERIRQLEHEQAESTQAFWLMRDELTATQDERDALKAALEKVSGALKLATTIRHGMREGDTVVFTGNFSRIPAATVSAILDESHVALSPSTKERAEP